eukprot:6657190-Karenia_brevis.AAC.1
MYADVMRCTQFDGMQDIQEKLEEAYQHKEGGSVLLLFQDKDIKYDMLTFDVAQLKAAEIMNAQHMFQNETNDIENAPSGEEYFICRACKVDGTVLCKILFQKSLISASA